MTTQENSADKLLKEVAGLYRFVRTPQLQAMGDRFGLSAGAMQVVYLDRLAKGYKLPFLAISQELLEEVGLL